MPELIELPSELNGSECHIAQTLVAGVGTCQVPNTSRIVGLQASVAGVRVRMNAAPSAAAAAKVGNVALAELGAGVSVPNTEMEYFVLQHRTNRTLHFKGAGAEVITIRFFG